MLVKLGPLTEKSCEALVKRWETSKKAFETAIPADILRALVIYCLWKSHFKYSNYDGNNNRKEKTNQGLIFFLANTFNSLCKKLAEEKKLDSFCQTLSKQLTEVVSKDDLVNFFSTLSQENFPTNHTFLKPFLTILKRRLKKLNESDIYKILIVMATITPNNSSDVIIELTNKLSKLNLQDLLEVQLRDTLVNYKVFCKKYKNFDFLIKTFSVCENLINNVENKGTLNCDVFFQMMANISSLFNLIKEHVSLRFKKLKNSKHKEKYNFLKSRHTTLINTSLLLINPTESKLCNIAHLYYSLCTEGNFKKHYDMCASFQRKLGELKSEIEFKDYLAIVLWSNTEFNTYIKESGNVKKYIDQFKNGDQKEKIEFIYQLTHLIQQKTHKNLKICLKQLLVGFLRNTDTLDILDLSKLLVALANCKRFKKQFNDFEKQFMEIKDKGLNTNNSKEEKEADQIFRKAKRIQQEKWL